jgi:nucleoside-diphosphate-sugar epimerase
LVRFRDGFFLLRFAFAMTPPFADPAALERIEDVAQLEELLSRPTPEVVETMRRMEGDLIILGVGGKTGPSLARMARRASDAAGVTRRIIGVSRFSQPGLREQLAADGIETVACDLLDRAQVAALPDAPNVIFSAAYKFGATGSAALTWAMNTYVPTLVAERYADARVVAYSSGNVYPLTPVTGPGSRESDPVAPLGEYA